MPIFIDDPDLLEKMRIVEGNDYLRNREYLPEIFGAEALYTFLNIWEQETSKDPGLKERAADIQVRSDGSSTIYGHMGINRYLLLYSGELIYLERQGGNLSLAVKAGFRIQ